MMFVENLLDGPPRIFAESIMGENGGQSQRLHEPPKILAEVLE